MKAKSTVKGQESKALTVIREDEQDVHMGVQLTAQYEKATGAMREVLIFGCMMMLLREKHPEMKERGNPNAATAKVKQDQMSTRGHLIEPTPLSLAKWLETYAPKVKRPSAIRFLHVAESVSEQYAEIVGAKVAKQFSLPALVTSPDLPAPAKAKLESLFEFVAGTSQRSWLDQFAPPADVGGNSYTRTPDKGKGKRKTAAQLKAEAKQELEFALNYLDGWFKAKHHTRVDKHQRVTAAAVLDGAMKKLNEVAD